jgi:diaminohydroxyphosphoribosylaminopyrimidine deaminase/5-amino-6-(5-phosphoribosylamino)uracil reductase
MYVTLEPCCHHGKTGPCTEEIIAAGIAKVVAATIDPSQHAAGRGIEQLRKEGIKVQTGVCENEARLLNAPFIKFAETGKCWVILKWAQTIDGRVAYSPKTRNSAPEWRCWISNELSRKDVHKLRRRVQAILVGINTVIADDPLLTARPSRGKKPTRIVLDTHLSIPLNCQLLSTAKKVPVLIVTDEGAIKANLEKADKITQQGATILTIPASQGQCDIEFLLEELAKRGVAQLLVEGGPTVLTSFLKRQLADEICVYITPKILGSQGSVGISEPPLPRVAGLISPRPRSGGGTALSLHHVCIKRFGDDIRLTGLTEKALPNTE